MQNTPEDSSNNIESVNSKNKSTQTKKEEKPKPTKKRKINWWPLKAMIISLVLSFAVNALSNLALSDTHIALAYVITVIIIAVGVFFDMIGTAATSSEVEPFLAMAARKVKGAKMAVKLSRASGTVSSVCCDIVGDICGVVSGVCAATIVTIQIGVNNFWLSILVYAIISTLTITLKAVAKNFAVTQSNAIVFGTAKFLSIFVKEA